MFTKEQAIAFHWQRYRTQWPTVSAEEAEDDLYDFRHHMAECLETEEWMEAAPGWEWKLIAADQNYVLVPKNRNLADTIQRSELPG